MATVNIDDADSINQYINSQQNTQITKDKYGEVFTPIVLINEILDNLPQHLWKNANYKWLDPCAGRGNFFLLVYGRLMNGLASTYPNQAQRKRHILSKMLYMNDLNSQNVKILRSVFGVSGANISGVDFLKEKEEDGKYEHENKKGVDVAVAVGGGDKANIGVWSGVATFNVILLNPPYQISKKAVYKGGRGNNHTLWDKFIEKSIGMLDAGDGWMGAITPANWRRPNHPLYKRIAPHLTFLHIYGKKEGLRLFNAQTRFDIYIMGGESGKHKQPLIIDEKGETHRNIEPFKWAFLPNYSYDKVERFFSLKKTKGVKNNTNKVIYDSNEYNSKTLSTRRTAKAKFPVVHTMTKKGMGIRWTSKKKGHYGKPKVLLNFNELLYPYNDWKGEYGMSQLTFGIPINSKKEGDKLVETFNSDDFKEAVKATKWGSFQTDYKMFYYLR
jgi:hypothetical protein